MKQTRRTFITALVALGLAGSVLVGTAGVCRAADGPQPKPEHVQKMQAALPEQAPAKPAKPRKVLVYGNAQGFVHSSIPLGRQTVAEVGKKTGAYESVVTNDPIAFDDLSQFDAVVLVSTTGRFLLPRGPEMKKPNTKGMSAEEKKAAEDKAKAEFEPTRKAFDEQSKEYKDKEKQRLQNLIDFVKGGKGLVGFHAATDAYYDVRPYGDLIGGYFAGHKAGDELIYVVNEDKSSPLTAVFNGKDFEFRDEIYRFTPRGKDGKDQAFSRERVRVLLSADAEKNKNEKPGTDMPVAWIQQAGEGRVFYSSLGHNEFVFWNPDILKFYLAGIQYATGDLKAEAAPQAKGSSAANASK